MHFTHGCTGELFCNGFATSSTDHQHQQL